MDGSGKNEGQDDISKKRLIEKDTVELKVNLDRRFDEMTYVLRKVFIDVAKQLSDLPKINICRCLDGEKQRLRKCLRSECNNTNVNLKEENDEVVMQYHWGDWPNGMVTCMRCMFEWDGYAQHCC